LEEEVAQAIGQADVQACGAEPGSVASSVGQAFKSSRDPDAAAVELGYTAT
jgi:hypothetical protein